MVKQLSESTYIHTSYLNTETFGRVACNGLVILSGKEAIVLDTPVDDRASVELIRWIEEKMDSKIKAVVATHFHVDCLGGFQAFYLHGIPSFAHQRTIKLAQNNGTEYLPFNGFDPVLELSAGSIKVINEYFGEGHTKDNIVTYMPAEQVLFGGCLIKSMGAGKGNLADANTLEWSATVKKLKDKFADVMLVVPGHGQHGGPELLDFTIELFESK